MSMTLIVILLGGFILLLALNVPVAFSMVLACIATLWWQGTIPISTVTMKLYSGIDTFPFLAIPLFILAGALMEQGGISARLVRLATNLVGHIRGGLGFVVVVSEIFFSGISGSSIADASAIGSLLLPSMVRSGYTAARATAIVAAATGMGMMIPPCLNMVVLGAVANISIAGLFMGGFLPGFLMALTLMVIIYIQSSRGTLPGGDLGQADLAGGAGLRQGERHPPDDAGDHLRGNLRRGVHRHRGRRRGHGVCVHRVVLPLQRDRHAGAVQDSGRYGGHDRGRLSPGRGRHRVLLDPGHLPGAAHARGLHHGRGGGQYTFMLLSIAVFLFFGMILDGLPAILIFFPILMPIALSLGVQPLHYGVLVIAIVGIAIVAPPIGLCLVILCSLAKIKLTDTIGPLIPYISILIADLVIMAFWPWLVMFLPTFFKL